MNLLHAREAAAEKQFVIDKVIEQALADEVPLSDAEKAMLGFSEATATREQMAVSETFEDEHDSKKYEAKMAKLIRRAYNRDENSGLEASWKRALTALNEKDCYLLIMVEQAGIKIPGRERLIAKAFFQKRTILTLSAMGVVGLGGLLFFFPIRNISPTPLRVYVVHNDLLTMVLFAFWLGLLWLIGEISRRV